MHSLIARSSLLCIWTVFFFHSPTDSSENPSQQKQIHTNCETLPGGRCALMLRRCFSWSMQGAMASISGRIFRVERQLCDAAACLPVNFLLSEEDKRVKVKFILRFSWILTCACVCLLCRFQRGRHLRGPQRDSERLSEESAKRQRAHDQLSPDKGTQWAKMRETRTQTGGHGITGSSTQE